MEKLLFTLILVLAVGIIYLITGRNRRQINKIPEGMAILCQPPGKRYVVYALGVLAVVFVGIFSILYIMDGAPRGGEGDVEPVCGNGNSAFNSYHICGKYHGEGMYLF